MKNIRFRAAIQKAVKDYNKYRSPEARVSVVKIGDDQLTMDFSGSFCRGCGVSDYFEDFIYELKQYATDVEMTILGFDQIEPEKFRVKFAFKLGHT